MTRSRMLFYICSTVVVLFTFIIGCSKDKCTKLAIRSKYKSNTSKSAAVKTTGFVPHTRENPMYMEWMNYDSINNGIRGCGKLNDIGEYEAAWVGFPQDIYIHKGNRLYLSTINCIVQGNILGEGLILFDNCKSILVVHGYIDSRITVDFADTNSEISIDVPLNNNTPIFNDWETIEIDCNIELPFIWRDPDTGITWKYDEV